MNHLISNIAGSASMELVQKASKLKQEGKHILDLAGGEPDFETPQAIKDAATKAIAEGDTHYCVGRGIPELLERIARKAREENGINCTSENVIVTPGAKFGIYLIVASMINPGDEVIIFAPYWVSYAPIIHACGGIPVSVELKAENGFRLEKETIMEAITDKTKLMIINYPNNPTGNTLLRSEADMLVEIIKEKRIHVISDEIYEKVIFEGSDHISIGSYKEVEDYVITVNGLSKSVAMTGWRVGYIIANPEIIKVMFRMYTHTVTCLSGFIQKAAVAAFDCQDEVEMMRRVYQDRRNFIIKRLSNVDGITCMNTEGSFYMWMHIEYPGTTQEMCAELIEKYGLVSVPGEAYGVTEKGHIRISFANSTSTIEEAVEVLEKFALTLQKNN